MALAVLGTVSAAVPEYSMMISPNKGGKKVLGHNLNCASDAGPKDSPLPAYWYNDDLAGSTYFKFVDVGDGKVQIHSMQPEVVCSKRKLVLNFASTCRRWSVQYVDVDSDEGVDEWIVHEDSEN